jgi:GNAT superfamily N-acetyltransferase
VLSFAKSYQREYLVNHKIVLCHPTDPLVESALSLVEEIAQLSWVILFGGDRWSPVEVVAVAMEEEQPVGMATLAPHDEMGTGGPHIIGVWVCPPMRSQGIGGRLVASLAEESQRRYGQAPTLVTVTNVGKMLAEAALHNGISIRVQHANDMANLP